MLNVLRPALARLLTPAGEALARTPVTPNAITVAGTAGVCAGALWLFPLGHLFAGTMVCTGFVLFDMLDGALARVKGTSGLFGAFLDSTLDRIGDAAVFSGLAIWLVRTSQRPLAAVALFCLVAGGLVSYAKARAQGLGIRCDVGVAERTERLLIALVSAGLTGLGVPYVLAIGLWALAALSAFTFGQRVHAVRAGARTAQAAARPPAGTGDAVAQPSGTAALGEPSDAAREPSGTMGEERRSGRPPVDGGPGHPLAGG
jgi:phosphatidylinositol phosphate synthase